MADVKLRQAIALEAARLMYERVESEYFTAKRKAAKRLCRRGVKPEDLPSNAEIRDQIQVFARIHEGDQRTEHLRDMRLEALRLMRAASRLPAAAHRQRHDRPRPQRAPTSTSTSSPTAVGLLTDLLEHEGFQFDVERKQIVKHERSPDLHAHPRLRPLQLRADRLRRGQGPLRLQQLDHRQGRSSGRRSASWKSCWPANIPASTSTAKWTPAESAVDPYPSSACCSCRWRTCSSRPSIIPKATCCIISLQVFELARDHRPYDEEFLLAALLHDVGKGLDPANHVAAALSALDGLITERTRFFIEHHMDAHDYRAGKLGAKLKRVLEASPDFEDLMLLRRLDDAGRVPGAVVGTVDEALDYLKELERSNG